MLSPLETAVERHGSEARGFSDIGLRIKHIDETARKALIMFVNLIGHFDPQAILQVYQKQLIYDITR